VPGHSLYLWPRFHEPTHATAEGNGAHMPTALVIDDDTSNSEAIAHVLGYNGYDVLTTVDPAEAARYCRDFNLDVVLADIILRSHQSGTDIATSLRQACPDIPVLFVSGTPLEGWSRKDFANLEALLPGRVAFLMKPFTAKALVEAVAKLIHREYSETEIRSALDVAKMFRYAA
jgi:CheY-like chemotaxis protein